ncbi:cytochrome C551 [Chryseobacterium sp. RP-3-3]|uniref:Cytochrome C551 n=1 Tax=Chryseobacterium antibioticum TaxID=2728847 RepID=A0A7Y0FSC4_9FLAO|nr:cytochrome C551 [Chryseobacterium antibioticum]NML70590.1 cytochrome C551 [Chryseobacterium antibioticum]
MKKLLLAAFGLGIVVVSCGTKESSMSSGNTDSTAAVNTKTVAPAATDSAKMAVPDSVRVDSVAATRPAK